MSLSDYFSKKNYLSDVTKAFVAEPSEASATALQEAAMKTLVHLFDPPPQLKHVKQYGLINFVSDDEATRLIIHHQTNLRHTARAFNAEPSATTAAALQDAAGKAVIECTYIDWLKRHGDPYDVLVIARSTEKDLIDEQFVHSQYKIYNATGYFNEQDFYAMLKCKQVLPFLNYPDMRDFSVIMVAILSARFIFGRVSYRGTKGEYDLMSLDQKGDVFLYPRMMLFEPNEHDRAWAKSMGRYLHHGFQTTEFTRDEKGMSHLQFNIREVQLSMREVRETLVPEQKTIPTESEYH